jgi:hypothetical protein
MMMEQKIVDTLHSMGVTLAQYFPRDDQKLYPLRRLGIEIPKIHHKDRQSKFTKIDRDNLIILLSELQRYADYYEIEAHSRYYVNLFLTKIIDILNE